MTADEIRDEERRHAEAREFALDAATGIYVGLGYDPALVRRFRDDLPEVLAAWLKRQAQTPAAPTAARIFRFDVLEGGRRHGRAGCD
jgi:hypothetical protein